MIWNPGSRLTHRFNPDLGAGIVQEIEGRTLVVVFPSTGTVLRMAANSDAILPLVFEPGARARILSSGEMVVIEGPAGPGVVRLGDGREIDEQDLWPLADDGSLTERLARGDVDKLESFALRLDALHLAAIREADGLGSFLGGRIRIFPHQLYAAEAATRSDPVRWLLADEVGLGKTVEACLILNHLLCTSRADRTVVVAPETLTVQWLGELWRKYHQVFVLLDDKRLEDVERDYGKGFNPFDAHGRVVVSLEQLIRRPQLTRQAVEADIDLLVVDEAHHLRRPPGHPGDAGYRAIEPIAAMGRHVLLLTATPLEDDAHGFFRLLQLLRPDEFPEDVSFEERLERGVALPACTSAARRADIGGLPPRVPTPVDLSDDEEWSDLQQLEAAMRALPAPHAVARKQKARKIRRALASGPALGALLDKRKEAELFETARRSAERDPRIRWLARQAQSWKRDGDKTLIFVAHRESLEAIRDGLSRLAQTRTGVFHEDLSAGQRDIEVAQFRLPAGPSILVSTECGGEGRNFEFCTRMVLFDVPWNPMTVEQRIGRLDRIGRSIPVEVVYFRPPAGLGSAVIELYESLGLFREPLGGLERELAGVEAAIEELALDPEAEGAPDRFESIVGGAREAFDRVQQAAYHELHRDPYLPALGPGILARVPQDLEELTEEVVVAACERLHLHIEAHRGLARYSIEIGRQARVENLPGVAGDASFLGSFDRIEALEDESIDFYATGHPLVEGILAHLVESSLGRVALLHIRGEGDDDGVGLLALYKHGPAFEAVALDAGGRSRPEWAEWATRRPLKSRRVRAESWTRQPGWPELIRSLARRLEDRGRPVAVAGLRVERRKTDQQ